MNDEREARRASAAIGFREAKLLENDGAQAFEFSNDPDCIIACRGTEPNEWNDVQADANATLAVVGALGKAHSGFKREVDDGWPMLEVALQQNDKTLWFGAIRLARR